MEEKVRIAPSILAADILSLEKALSAIRGEVDLLHLDIMDGHFVPNISFGPKVISDIKRRFSQEFLLEVHLMVENPSFWAEVFAKAGGDIIVFHWEAERHPLRLIRRIKDMGKKAGLAFNPATLWENAKLILPEVDYVLIMSVDPGFSGQSFIPWIVPKVKAIREFRDENRLAFEIVVDGGVNPENAPLLREAGATVLVGGASIFCGNDPVSSIRALRGDRANVE